MLDETADGTRESSRDGAQPRPGIVVAFSGVSAMSLVLAAGEEPLVIGRAGQAGALLSDHRLSRSHCSIAVTPDGWVVRDLGSRNGTFVDGEPIEGEETFEAPCVVRAADTIVLPCADLTGFSSVATRDGAVLGWRMQAALAEVDRAAAGGDTLLLGGESGTGKELAARRFHARGPNSAGPFVAVNCATIPQGLAERLLFGARKGAYSGATADVIGHLRAADGGVLFLDEAGELDLQVQAKLLRALETREVMPLGATQPVAVDVRVCLATHVSLRRAVSDGRFREDLYHRVAPPEVTLPPLRDRLEEAAHHVVAELAVAAPGVAPQAKLVEACLLRHWPGNVRELRRHVRDAAGRALAEKADRVRLEHLAPEAGQPLGPSAGASVPPSRAGTGEPDDVRPYVRRAGMPTREAVERALRDSGGNVSRAARSLGMQRTQLYREIERHALERPGKRH